MLLLEEWQMEFFEGINITGPHRHYGQIYWKIVPFSKGSSGKSGQGAKAAEGEGEEEIRWKLER